MPYTEIFEAFPSELRLPVARLVDALKAEFEVRRSDSEPLQAAVQDLVAAQARTQDELTLFRRTFTSQIGGLGARWGLQTEEAFQQGIRTILGDVGFTTERFLTWDAAGEVFGHPDQVELDVVIQNGAVIVVEIQSSPDRANTYLFDRKVAFYTRHTGRQVARKVVVFPIMQMSAPGQWPNTSVSRCVQR